MLQQHTKNPFQYLTPDQIGASEALNLFVDVFRDYYQVLNPGNTFINGPRGSGKSMMFRIMKPDCQRLKSQKRLNDIDFYSIHVPIKETSLNLTELQILEQSHGGNFLNEHYLVIYFSIVIFDSLAKEDYSEFEVDAQIVEDFASFFSAILKKTGYTGDFNFENCENISEVFAAIHLLCSEIQTEFVVDYLGKLLCGNTKLPYLGPLCLYQNFLLPILKRIKDFSFLPDAPLYLLVDDADELNLTQTKILNSWVSFRSTSFVCFKISTQLKYQTFFTTKNSKIDSPHDYFEITLNQVYTSEQRNRYNSNVKEIVEKRLSTISNIGVTAEDFFPSDKQQAIAIDKIFVELKNKKMLEGKSEQQAYDFAYRNARPDYMIGLNNQYTYSYAGFDQLVHLSSGIIRSFLDLAAKMFTATINAQKEEIKIDLIPVNIQNTEITQYSYAMLSNEFEKLLDDKNMDNDKLNKHKKLRNLIDSLGKAFRIILESNSSERRKFAFYFDHELSDELREILKLGVIYGYFHTNTLASKSGLGRSKLYILNRMLAPYFKLDPMSFSGYLYLTSTMLNLAVVNPKSFLKKIQDKEYSADTPYDSQLELFDQFSNETN
ncbi:hypothetical protein [Mucilaginibacter sp. CSA2-8R]|uniref:ORC-CDC6 family AAA ATPase n=1 Tax=Mucilaginibacter sp. CSA2-8R TaxID=3141542 RepID=UPI00315CB21E